MTPEALKFTSATLDNGLRVVAVPQPQLHRAHVALYVRVGSRFESRESNGLSHFLEHMLYRGTKSLPTAHHVNLAFERLGGYLFASTQTDHGIFSVTLPPESLPAACALFGEVLGEPGFFDIDIERGIVLEEILEDLDDEGRQVDADNISRALIYPSHPLGFTITGTEKLVRSFDQRALRAHHARHYAGLSSILVFAGAVDEGVATELAAKAFGRFPRGRTIAAEPPVHRQKKPRMKIVENVSSQTELRICLRAIPESSPDRPALDMLMRIVDDGMSTRLYQRLCDDRGLCYDVSAGYDGYEDDGVIDVVAGVQHARVSVVAREVLALVRDLAREGPTEEELAKAKQRQAWETTAMLDSAEEMAGFFARGLLFDRFETPAERKAKVAAVSAEDVRRVAATVAEPSRLNVVAVGLLENDEDKRLAEVIRGYKA